MIDEIIKQYCFFVGKRKGAKFF